MARDPLGILLAMRQRSVEQARSELGACLKAEAVVAGRIASLDEAAQRDSTTSGEWQDAHHFLEMSAIRLEVVRGDRLAAEQALTAAEACSAEARGVVTAAQTAAEAVEQLISERDVIERAEAAKREQHVLDDIARSKHRRTF